MAHALVWTQISPTDLTSEIKREIPYAGFGTVVSNGWNKRIFRLKWQNASVENIRVWLDEPYPDIYTTNEFPTIKKQSRYNIFNDLGFDIRVTPLDSYNIIYLPNAKTATNFHLSSSSIAGTTFVTAPLYVDGAKISFDDLILVKNQNSYNDNGLYKINVANIGTGATFFYAEEIITAGRVISTGSSSLYSYMQGYKPYQFALTGTTEVKWIDITNSYRLEDVVTSSQSNLNSAGSALTSNSRVLDNVTLDINDRVLIKEQTDPRENGIYYVSSLFASNKNKIIDPNTSTDQKDNYWKDALYNVFNDIPVEAQVLFGSTTAGKHYRFYKTDYGTIIPYSILDDMGGGGGGEDDSVIEPNGNTGLGETLVSNWTDNTHYYERTYTTWYYEIGLGSTIEFNSGIGNSGTFTLAPCNLLDYDGNSTLTAVGQSILIKHWKPELSGIYNIKSVSCDYNSVWERSPEFDDPSDYNPKIIYVENNRSDIGSPIFYLNPDPPYNDFQPINNQKFSINPRFKWWTYQPVSNLITKEINNFNRVNEKDFNNSGIAISQRVLVTGQATTASQNGIYIVSNSSSGSTFGLSFYDTYWIKNGSIANSAGSNDIFMLYSDSDNVSFGSAGVTFFSITGAANTTVNHYVSIDKTSSEYISPDDFGSEVQSGDLILMNTGGKSANNGVYLATAGVPYKAIFNYPNGLKNWFIDIYRNILQNYKSGTYTVSPNFRNQISGIYNALMFGGFSDTSFATRNYGNIYIPECEYIIGENPVEFFDSEYLGSSLIQETNLTWNKADYQSYVVKGIWYRSNLTAFPLSSATATSSKLSDGTIVNNNDDILVWIGASSSVANTYNGIYRAISINGSGSSVYFKKHEDFNFNTSYIDGTNVKNISSPYERPTKVIIQNGYFSSSSAFAYTAIYMQGMIGYRSDITKLGSTAITSYDDKQYNIGQETFQTNSFIRLSRDYAGIGTFPKLAPIQHFVTGDLKNKDTVDGDILILNRGEELFTLNTDTNVKYYYEIGDRVIYQDQNELQYLTNTPNYINGIYQIVYVNSITWTYYLRKIKQTASYGHLDHYKKLLVHSNNTIEDVNFSLIKYGGDGSTYYFNIDNYSDINIFTINSSGITTNYIKDVDYTIYPNLGYISRISSFGSSDSEFYCYIRQDNSIPNYNEEPKTLYNNNFVIENVLVDKERLTSGLAITSSSVNIENQYFQLTNSIGNATTSDIKNNKNRNHWYKTLNNSFVYKDDIKYIVSVGNTNQYYFTSRLSSDGYYTKAGSSFTSTFYDTDLFDPATGKTTGLFTGNFYIEKIDKSNGGLAVSYWFYSINLNANDNILILSNNSSLIADTFQSQFYNDNNILIKHISSGKKDQKIVSFEKFGYTPVTVTYDGSMTNPLTPLKVYAGSGTYYLHYNPANNNLNTNSKKFYEETGIDIYNCNVSTNSNISNINDIGGSSINSYNVAVDDVILVKNQNNDYENGIYSIIRNRLFNLTRSKDLDGNDEIKSLARVSYNRREYELILPSTGTYSIGNTAGNTPIIWNPVGYAQTIDIAMVTFNNFSGTALTNDFPDSYGGYTFEEDDKILLAGQTDETLKYIGRFTKKIEPTFTRVTSSIATTAGFAITACHVLDTNRQKFWELYFDHDVRAIGVGSVNWFEQNYLTDYISASFASTNNVGLGDTIPFPNFVYGDVALLKDQSNKKQNGIYYIDNKTYYYLIRHQNLNFSTEISGNYKINVMSGFNNTGYYGLTYNEAGGTSLIGSTTIFWAKVFENNVLESCGVATTENISLTNPPRKIDGITLENGFRILVKNQTNKIENGIYVVKDKDNKTWARATDLDENIELQPQLSLSVDNGDSNINNIYRIKIAPPRTITNTQANEYIIGTDTIEWEEVEAEGLFNNNPVNWQKIGLGVTEALYLGPAEMDKYYVAKSPRFAIAIKAPTASQLAAIGISESGKVRNLKFKVEYNIKED